MRKTDGYKTAALVVSLLFVLSPLQELQGQNRILVWSEEFDGPDIDGAVWNFDEGLSNDNVHYYTDRSDNARIVDSTLYLIALEESYMGMNYTSALINTKNKVHWRYGRMEARIRLPGTPGFVPAFWMLPADARYGWWPYSGEIDIMEHPTNQVTTIYGTVHSEAYNLFFGAPPQGGTVEVADAGSQFHVYAVEWTEDQIEFFVDGQNYYTFSNDQGGSDTWPFNQSFYIILNLAVGGAWVGDPTGDTVFPAVMEVDYVRVFQYPDDIAIKGEDFLPYNTQSVSYSLPAIEGAIYSWDVPGNAEIISGMNTNQINVDWNIFGGSIEAEMQHEENTLMIRHAVDISQNYLKNPGFEKGTKYWSFTINYAVADAELQLSSTDVHYGGYSLSAEITTPGNNPWDVQVSQQDLVINAGITYECSFWARANSNDAQVNAAVTDPEDFFLYALNTFTLSDSWARYSFTFTPNNGATVNLNIDLGAQAAVFSFDDFEITTRELYSLNQIKNADLMSGDNDWNFVTLGGAVASGSVENETYAVSIENGGSNPWDVHLGQDHLLIENGKEYVISFDARADFARNISVLVGLNADPWIVYSGDQNFSLTAERQNYTFSFTMDHPTDSLARFGFDIGGSSIDVYFDNIMLREQTAPSSIAAGNAKTADSHHLYQNYPNPFNSASTITYRLPQPADVSLKIFNLIGQEIATLVSGQEAGEHQITWRAQGLSSGIYFYRLQTGEYTETRKIILQK